MVNFLRRNVKFLLVIVVSATFGLSAPAVSHGVKHALFAHNSEKVDGKHAVGAGASVNKRKGKLVATSSSGRLPNNIITKAPDSGKLGGVNASSFVRGVASAELPGRFRTLSGSAVTVLTIPVATGAECGSQTRHRYLVEGSGFVSASSGTPRMSLVADNTGIVHGPGFTLATVPSGGYAVLASSRVLELPPGGHNINLNADAFSGGSGSMGDPSLVVSDLGYHCNGGTSPRLSPAPRSGGSPTG